MVYQKISGFSDEISKVVRAQFEGWELLDI